MDVDLTNFIFNLSYTGDSFTFLFQIMNRNNKQLPIGLSPYFFRTSVILRTYCTCTILHIVQKDISFFECRICVNHVCLLSDSCWLC
jgi:hypothetical protein